MRYISTRNHHVFKSLSEAIRLGLAEDGGLFIPEYFPTVSLDDFRQDLLFPEFTDKLLQPFFIGDHLENKLTTICHEALNFPIPLTHLNHNTEMLELFHGPTLSFKDVGARFLAECLNASSIDKLTIMVATSGDTGSAVASAFYRKKNINVVILYPLNKISAIQEHQITCWGDNVLAIGLQGSFDDCQRIIKSAFEDDWWKNEMYISSANSINIGRLLPQMSYYAYTSLQYYHKHKTDIGFIVPSGNLGNATAAYWAKQMGFPIREIALATNANRVIENYLEHGIYHPEKSVSTLANAMDVGNPSNFERMQALYPDFAHFKQNVQAISVSDEDIANTIKNVYNNDHKIICPHTATAFFMRQHLSDSPWAIVATADASKFENVINPIIKQPVPIPESLKKMLNQQIHHIEAEPTIDAVKQTVMQHYHGKIA